MIKQFLLIIFISMFVFFAIGCKTDNKKKFKQQYFPSGILKNKGWYIRDSIAVDTIIHYFENGNTYLLEVRNDSGYLNGAIKSYYENGRMQELMNYKNDNLEGFSYHFRKDGTIESKIFYTKDKKAGDCFWYDSTNTVVRKYGFYDLEGHNRNLIIYDSIGNILKDFRQVIYIDSIRTYLDSINNSDVSFYNVLLLISNPPKCRTTITIDYLKGLILKRKDSIIDQQYYFRKKRFSDSITSVKYSGVQYDSIKKSFLYQKGSVTIDN